MAVSSQAATNAVIAWVCAVTSLPPNPPPLQAAGLTLAGGYFREEVAASAIAPYVCKAGPVEGCKQARREHCPTASALPHHQLKEARRAATRRNVQPCRPIAPACLGCNCPRCGMRWPKPWTMAAARTWRATQSRCLSLPGMPACLGRPFLQRQSRGALGAVGLEMPWFIAAGTFGRSSAARGMLHGGCLTCMPTLGHSGR